VRWKTDRLARRTALLLLLTTACSAPPTTTATPTPIQPSIVPSAEPSVGPEPGRPYAAADVLEAMRTSPRPDGVPAELQTDAIAGSIADELWTLDGRQWDVILIGASCGEPSCVVEVAGSRDGAAGEDLWTFGVDRASGAVSIADAVLGAIPEGSIRELDMRARALLDETELEGLSLAAATWQPPPAAGRFELSYRSGGEEGSCGLDVVLDADAGAIVDQRPVGDC
jgi:hypothetical protein